MWSRFKSLVGVVLHQTSWYYSNNYLIYVTGHSTEVMFLNYIGQKQQRFSNRNDLF
jgi:hypothetical protein